MWWWEARKITVAEIIASTHPHVIGLQEVRVGECRLKKGMLWRGLGEQALRALYSVLCSYRLYRRLSIGTGALQPALMLLFWEAYRAVYCPFFIFFLFFLVLSFPSLLCV